MGMQHKPTPRQQGEAAARTFERWFAADHLRERYSRAHRGVLLKKINAGEPISGYRAQWIAATANQLVKVLQEATIGFDAAFPWDKCLPEDLEDALCSAGARVKGDDPDDDLAEAAAFEAMRRDED